MKTNSSKEVAAVSKMISLGIVVVVVIIGIAGSLYVSTSNPPQALVAVSRATARLIRAAVQVSITPGASNSANAPGYSPDSITLVVGKNNAVTWTNDDSAHHTVTTISAPPGASFNSGDMGSGVVYTCTFTTPGTSGPIVLTIAG